MIPPKTVRIDITSSGVLAGKTTIAAIIAEALKSHLPNTDVLVSQQDEDLLKAVQVNYREGLPDQIVIMDHNGLYVPPDQATFMGESVGHCYRRDHMVFTQVDHDEIIGRPRPEPAMEDLAS